MYNVSIVGVINTIQNVDYDNRNTCNNPFEFQLFQLA